LNRKRDACATSRYKSGLQAEIFARGLKIVRRRGFKLFSFAAPRMSESQLPRVEHLPREIAGAFPRVRPVPKHRVSEVEKMHPDLVSAPAVNPAFDKAGVGRLGGHSIFRLRGAAARCRGRHPCAVHGMTRNRRIDESGFFAKPAGDQSEINFIDTATGKLRRETAVRFIIFSHDKTSAGVLVETVNNPRPLFTADA
jgi:hypothetical protein